jgi:hypothetical protein
MKHDALAFFGLSFQAMVLLACGSSASPASKEGTTSPEGGTDAGLPNEAATVTVPPAWADAGMPITGLNDMTWTWVAVPEAQCRDGSATGFWVNPNSASKKLMIFLEGGGACFNSFTCQNNPASAPGGGTYSGSSQGIMNRGDTSNPVSDWNIVEFPYCTGDVFAGAAPNASVSGVTGMQQFVGYANVAAFLKRIVPTFPSVTQVLLTGVSAGGFGSSANYGQVARAFAPVPVTLLDDSGPQMRDPYLAKCLLQEQAMLWRFDKTILAECGSDCPDMGSFPIDASRHTAKMYPQVPLALIEATDDSVITGFFGFGLNSCTGTFFTPVPKQQFTDGLNDARMQLSAYPNIGGFIFDGTRHTSISTQSAFDSQTATGGDGSMVALKDWITDMVVNGKISNVGPP